MTNSTDGAKEWVSIRIPESTRDKASDDERTYEQIMLDGLDVDREPAAELTAQVTPELDGEDIEELAEKVTLKIENEVTEPQLPNFDAIADRTAERVVEELQGVMR